MPDVNPQQADVNRAVQQQLQQQRLMLENFSTRLHNVELVLLVYLSQMREATPVSVYKEVHDMGAAFREACKALGHDFDTESGNTLVVPETNEPEVVQ